MITITRMIGYDSSSVSLEINDSETPLVLKLQMYDGGVVVHIPWFRAENLGGPNYWELKRSLRPHFQGIIGTRTESKPSKTSISVPQSRPQTQMGRNRIKEYGVSTGW